MSVDDAVVFLTLPVRESRIAGLMSAVKGMLATEGLALDLRGGTSGGLIEEGQEDEKINPAGEDPDWPKDRIADLYERRNHESKFWPVLVRMAQQPRKCTTEDLCAALGLSRASLAGVFGPIGKYRDRFHKGIGLPYEQVPGGYRMKPEVAKAILEVDAAGAAG